MEFVVLGDLNIDTSCQTNSNIRKLNDILSSHNLRNIVDFPTRIDGSSSTSIDHVYVNRELAHAARARPLITLLSDHYAVRATIPCDPGPGRAPPRFGRCYSRSNKCSFIAALDSIDWDDVERKHSKSADNLAQAVVNILQNKNDTCFPSKRLVSTNNRIVWATNDIFNLNYLLIDMHKLLALFPNNIELGLRINEYQDKYDNLLKSERSNYYSNLINNSENLIKSMWNVVKTETGRTSQHSDYTEFLKQPDGSAFSSKMDVVNAVNAYFITATANCNAPAADVGAARRALSAARPPADRSLRIRPFTALEVYRILSFGVARKHSKDVYDISISVLHIAAQSISPILSRLYNKCVREGRYPLPLKQVKVTPLYKGKGKQEEISSYRPISIIPGIAKIFEHGLSTRLTDHLTDCGALSDRQYAYRPGRSTTAVAKEVVRRVLEAREGMKQVAVIFCDLSKAFDVADHGVLATKLEHYGIEGPALKLLTDFMVNRNQVVVGDGGRAKSQPQETVIGVAQGSSLSNIMFSLLLNDLPQNIQDGHILMYADDVAAVVTASSIDELEQKLNKVTKNLCSWFKINGLILNTNKTHYIHFNMAGRAYRPLKVGIDDVLIEQVKTTTFLGFQIDSALTWEEHIDKVCDKVGRACFALWRVSAILPHAMVRQCYFASVHSILQYGVELWGRAADWERVFRMQKRAVRAIVRVPQDASALEYFRAMRILTIPSLVCLQAALYAWDHPEQYTRFGEVNPRTRHPHRLHAVTHRLAKTSKLIHVTAPEVYNRLPHHVRDAPSRASFKHRLKNWLVEQAFYKFDDIKNIKETI